MSAEAPPPGVLVQSVYVTEEGEESGWRVWEDGRHESRAAGGPWTEVETLDDARLQAVRGALDGADPAALSGVHGEASEGQGAGLRFQAVSGGVPFAVELVGGARLDALDALNAQLIAALAGPGYAALGG